MPLTQPPYRLSTRCCAAALALVLSAPAFPLAATDSPPAPPRLSLEGIMADPDWIGNSPENPSWSEDGTAIYYRQKQVGHEQHDLVRCDLATGANRVLALSEHSQVDGADFALSRDRKRKAFVRDGDLFVEDLPKGPVRQLTRTSHPASDPQFMANDRQVSFRIDDDFFIIDLSTGLMSQAADLQLKKDPAEEDPDPSYLVAQQRRLFDAIKDQRTKAKERREHDQALQLADPSRAPLPIYLGDKIKIERGSLSPSGDWLILVTVPKDAKNKKKARMPNYVTESGFIEDKEVRSLVGTENPIPQSLLLVDLKTRKRYPLALDELPGILSDPLKDLRDKADAARKSEHDRVVAASAAEGHPLEDVDKAVTAEKDEDKDKDQDKSKDQDKTKDKSKEANAGTTGDHAAAPEASKKPKPRAVDLLGISWSEDGARAVIALRSADNKDRWLTVLEPASHHLVSRHHLIDPAWVTWDFNDFGWLRDNQTVFYQTEETGYSQIGLVGARDGEPRLLTHGDFEISNLDLSRDGRYLYFVANAEHPGIHEIWRVPVAGGASEQITKLGGGNTFTLSPDGKQVLVLHSERAHPPELYVQETRPGAAARKLTSTTSSEFLAQPWSVPEVVPIPSSHVQRPIYSRVYTPAGNSPDARPAVVFVHGAGYLQDAHYGWSSYFHEFMFHTLLVQRGYVVLDMDYRASAGYGRDWRTAIYRNMGHPELEDLEDGVAWLVAQRHVDPKRVGVYGGSYGGFMTLMALFRRPELFASGAALRPVTDWAHYNEFYSGAILNAPEVDPEAYTASSPIEFASGLSHPLQICAGMQDDNVFFQDDVRLVQRLIELKKENFNVAFYPLEAHGFRAPIAWLDEYRRIYKLFETTLR